MTVADNVNQRIAKQARWIKKDKEHNVVGPGHYYTWDEYRGIPLLSNNIPTKQIINESIRRQTTIDQLMGNEKQ